MIPLEFFWLQKSIEKIEEEDNAYGDKDDDIDRHLNPPYNLSHAWAYAHAARNNPAKISRKTQSSIPGTSGCMGLRYLSRPLYAFLQVLELDCTWNK
jgi:hypothetical protein